ncbi:MAG: hypothetical protein IJ232_02320 [Lachnospiraceae bacterium]|nr:hypothetical protein [Lachnospiraceae bacterium]
MKRALKRIIAVIMAVMMCIPSNAATVLAANVDTPTEEVVSNYIATINSVEHGVIKFTEYDGLETREFEKGESVKITLVPDEDYKVSQLKVTNTDTGKVLAQKDTSDNRFAFAMPAKNVTITASFAQKEKSINLLI